MVDDGVHGFAEGHHFYKRIVERFARLCYTMSVNHFALERQSPLSGRSPKKVFIYYSSANPEDPICESQAISFLSASVPYVLYNPDQLRATVRDSRQEVIGRTVRNLTIVPQDMKYYPVGFCAETLPFSTCAYLFIAPLVLTLAVVAVVFQCKGWASVCALMSMLWVDTIPRKTAQTTMDPLTSHRLVILALSSRPTLV